MHYFLKVTPHNIIARIAQIEKVDKIVAALIFIVFLITSYLYIRGIIKNSGPNIFSVIDKIWNDYGKPSKKSCEPSKWHEYCEEVNKVCKKYRKPPMYCAQDMDNFAIYKLKDDI